jgi:hypothetical protein
VGWRYVMPDGRKGATPTAMAALLHALFMTPVRYHQDQYRGDDQ